MMPQKRPSITSIWRLDSGLAIRVVSARRVFNAIQARRREAGLPDLDPAEEIIKEDRP